MINNTTLYEKENKEAQERHDKETKTQRERHAKESQDAQERQVLEAERLNSLIKTQQESSDAGIKRLHQEMLGKQQSHERDL